MENLYIAACDDQPEVLDAFIYIIKDNFAKRDINAVIKKFTDPTLMIKALENEYFDLLFLDIEMPQLDGISLARELRKVGNKIDIIFVTHK